MIYLCENTAATKTLSNLSRTIHKQRGWTRTNYSTFWWPPWSSSCSCLALINLVNFGGGMLESLLELEEPITSSSSDSLYVFSKNDTQSRQGIRREDFYGKPKQTCTIRIKINKTCCRFYTALHIETNSNHCSSYEQKRVRIADNMWHDNTNITQRVKRRINRGKINSIRESSKLRISFTSPHLLTCAQVQACLCLPLIVSPGATAVHQNTKPEKYYCWFHSPRFDIIYTRTMTDFDRVLAEYTRSIKGNVVINYRHTSIRDLLRLADDRESFGELDRELTDFPGTFSASFDCTSPWD